MSESTTRPARAGASRPLRRRPAWPYWLLGAGSVPVLLFGVSLALAPPLTPRTTVPGSPAKAEPRRVEAAEGRLDALAWPEQPLDGLSAKRLLLDVLLAARDRLEATPGYTATLRRQERVKGKLGPTMTLQMKVRHRPFAVYLKFLDHDAGKEVIYAEGFHDNHLIGHGGGLTRLLLPYLKTPPNSALAMAGNRHPVTDAGLLNLTRRLVHFRRMDLEDEEAGTVLDRVTDEQGRTYLRSVHTHPRYQPERPFAYVEVLYDPQTKLPVQITGYDWTAPGAPDDPENRILGERYRYDDLTLDAPLTDRDFDPTHPDYNFKRF